MVKTSLRGFPFFSFLHYRSFIVHSSPSFRFSCFKTKSWKQKSALRLWTDGEEFFFVYVIFISLLLSKAVTFKRLILTETAE